MGPLIPLFWTSGDVCVGSQSQGGSPVCVCFLTCVILRFTSGVTPADCTEVSTAAQPFRFMYLQTCPQALVEVRAVARIHDCFHRCLSVHSEGDILSWSCPGEWGGKGWVLLPLARCGLSDRGRYWLVKSTVFLLYFITTCRNTSFLWTYRLWSFGLLRFSLSIFQPNRPNRVKGFCCTAVCSCSCFCLVDFFFITPAQYSNLCLQTPCLKISAVGVNFWTDSQFLLFTFKTLFIMAWPG